MLAPFDLPKGILLLITDELSAPADFLLHQASNAQIKEKKTVRAESPKPSVLVISTFEDLNKWKSVSLKSNVSLAQHISAGLAQFIDISKVVQPNTNGSESNRPLLNPILELVFHALEGADLSQSSEPLVILDDTATLEWIGFSSLDIFRFIRALCASCLKAGASLIVRHHIATPKHVDDLFQQLLSVCSYHLDVKPLYSGRSGAVSGEIALHSGPVLRSDGVKLIPRSSSLQYRLTDGGPVYFQKGTSEGVL